MGLPRRGWPEAQASPNVSSHDDLPRAPGATKRDTARRTASIPCSHWRLGGTAGRVPTAIAPRRGDVVELELDVAAGPCDCGAWPVSKISRPACCHMDKGSDSGAARLVRIPCRVEIAFRGPAGTAFRPFKSEVSHVRTPLSPSASATANKTESHWSRGSWRDYRSRRGKSGRPPVSLSGVKASNQCPGVNTRREFVFHRFLGNAVRIRSGRELTL